MYLQGKRIDSIVIENVSNNLGLEENIVHKIHSFQFKKVREGLRTVKSIEVTDLITLKINPKMLKRKLLFTNEQLKIWEDKLLTTPEDTEAPKLISYYKKQLEFLKTKQ